MCVIMCTWVSVPQQSEETSANAVHVHAAPQSRRRVRASSRCPTRASPPSHILRYLSHYLNPLLTYLLEVTQLLLKSDDLGFDRLELSAGLVSDGSLGLQRLRLWRHGLCHLCGGSGSLLRRFGNGAVGLGLRSLHSLRRLLHSALLSFSSLLLRANSAFELLGHLRDLADVLRRRPRQFLQISVQLGHLRLSLLDELARSCHLLGRRLLGRRQHRRAALLGSADRLLLRLLGVGQLLLHLAELGLGLRLVARLLLRHLLGALLGFLGGLELLARLVARRLLLRLERVELLRLGLLLLLRLLRRLLHLLGRVLGLGGLLSGGGRLLGVSKRLLLTLDVTHRFLERACRRHRHSRRCGCRSLGRRRLGRGSNLGRGGWCWCRRLLWCDDSWRGNGLRNGGYRRCVSLDLNGGCSTLFVFDSLLFGLLGFLSGVCSFLCFLCSLPCSGGVGRGRL
mmetsp:Transcript_3553/g.7577  ORF Transcript_3553/g.7577 Transcript_3553/m.7577 type:complete len:453 (-) Transcript_3553:502-1860(-)